MVADLRDALEDFDDGSIDLVHSRYVEFTGVVMTIDSFMQALQRMTGPNL